MATDPLWRDRAPVAPGGPAGKAAAGPGPERPQVYTVSELTRRIRSRLETSFPAVRVGGEISNLKRPASGHLYLTLKDARAQIRGVLWRSRAATLRFEPRDGMEVIALGRLTVYEPRGDYQLVIERLEPQGVGALQLAFEELKRKLHAEGLFDPERKRPLPALPRRVALVTSPTGAAVRDMIRILTRRFPRIAIVVVPVLVQGEEAPGEICRGIEVAGREAGAEVVIVGRGGGSLEDLWAFNTEEVARAVAACPVPTVSAVGHEVDVTICDFVADRRAATPSAAAELVVPELRRVLADLRRLGDTLSDRMRRRLREARLRLQAIARSYALRHPAEVLARHRQRADELGLRIARAMRTAMDRRRERVQGLGEKLEALSPLGILERGYSITMREGESAPLRDPEGLAPGDRLRTVLHQGRLLSRVVAIGGDAGQEKGCVQDAGGDEVRGPDAGP